MWINFKPTGKHEGDQSKHQTTTPEDEARECDVIPERRTLFAFVFLVFEHEPPIFIAILSLRA